MARDVEVTVHERIAAFQLAIENMPKRSQWQGAVAMRGDGSSPAGVFAVLDLLRMTYQARIGDLGAGEASGTEWMPEADVNASTQDRITAYEMAIESLPRSGMWLGALSQRQDGTNTLAIMNALGQIRTELQQRRGDLQGARSGP